MTKQIDDALGLRTVPAIYEEKDNLPALGEEQGEEDVDQAREGLYNALEMSKQAVQDMVNIAQQSQHPKAYEVLNSAIKTMADISMGLAELQIKKKRIVNKPAQEQQNVTNNPFVGSTAELQQMLEDMKNKSE